MPQTSSQMPQCSHKRFNRHQTSFSHYWSSKSLNSCKMRPHSGSYFLYCPQICHLLIRIDSKQRKLSCNYPEFPNFRLQSTQIVTQSSLMPQIIQNSSQIGPNSSQIDSNCIICLQIVSDSSQIVSNCPESFPIVSESSQRS